MSIENGCYYCKSCDICDNKNCLVNKQKAEIERLTEEKKQEIIKSFKSCVIDKNGDCTNCTYDNHRIHCGKKDLMQDVFELIQYQQAEIERLTERENDLVEDKAHWIGKWKEQVEYTADLQKQVDELKEENANLKQGKAIMLDGITDLNRLVQFPVEYEGKNFEDIAELGNYIQEQAIKDTSKEILQKIMSIIKKSGGFLAEELVRIWAKQNGVEVDE